MKPIPIPEPYWNAGREFHWDKVYRQTGIPVPTAQLEGDGYVYVRVQNKMDIWDVSKQRARMIVQKYKSKKIIEEKEVSIVPWDAFQKV